MDKGLQWLEAIITVVFDLEEGQLPDKIIPPDYGSEKDRKTISYNSFPDSFTFNLEGQTVYSFYLRKGTRRLSKKTKTTRKNSSTAMLASRRRKTPRTREATFKNLLSS